MKRVVVTGAECTGKTTLARSLAAELGVPWVPEYARQFVDEIGRDVQASDIEAIARGQIGAEDRAAASGPPLLLLDTDLLSTMVYSRYYFGHCPAWVEEQHAARPASLYLLADIDPVWEAERFQRASRDPRAEQAQLFEAALRASGRPVARVGGEPQQRLVAAGRLIADVMAEPNDPGLRQPG